MRGRRRGAQGLILQKVHTILMLMQKLAKSAGFFQVFLKIGHFQFTNFARFDYRKK